MNNAGQVAIVIPLYRENLLPWEEVSLCQAFRVFSGYDIYAACPKGLEYGCRNKFEKEVQFDSCWFRDVRAYSELMLQREFYQAFAGYEYILVYQLDAFAFSDQLLEFCRLGYDYIGAPWIHGIACYRDAKHILHYVGNGGFSLRKVTAFVQWLEEADLEGLEKTVNEDVLIAAYGEPFLKIAPVETALRFSFDMDPRGCLVRNGNRLPFGCHAWQRIDMKFWRPFIGQCGYDLRDIPDSGLYDSYKRRYGLEDMRNILLDKLCDREKIKLRIERLTDSGEKALYIWGTGVWGTFAGRIFEEFGIPFAGFTDNYGSSREYLGYPVYSGPEYLGEGCSGRAVFIAVVSSEEIVRQLEQAGYVHMESYMALSDM